jgi:hypothetical protein
MLLMFSDEQLLIPDQVGNEDCAVDVSWKVQ